MKKRVKETKNVTEEAQFIKQKKLDYNLVKVLTGDWKGTKVEHNELENIKKIIDEDIYIEAIYVLTHKIIRDVKEAKSLYRDVLEHRDKLIKKLKRKVGIETAILDYFKNIKTILKEPEIIEKKKLLNVVDKAITDATTGGYDRSTLDANLDAEVERAKRYRRPISLLFCDLDDFKKINDKYGHPTGDIVLKKTFESITGVLRATDMAYRYGGEEFVCLLPETDIKSAAIAARRIRKKISSLMIPTKQENPDLKVTISIGVAQFGVGEIKDAQTFISTADKMMYKAKMEGKNCVQVYGEIERKKGLAKKKSDVITKKKKQRTILNGQTISSGFAIGKAFVYRDILSRNLFSYDVREEKMDEELQRIRDSISTALKELHRMEKVVESDIDRQHADIFKAHKVMLEDEQVIKELEVELKRELVNSEQIVKNVFRKIANKFRNSEQEFIKSKGDDVEDLGRRLIRILLGYDKSVLEELSPGSIVVSNRLLPSDTVHLNSKNVRGIIVQEGSGNSHSAILARTLGIPAISNCDKSIDLIDQNDELILDGERRRIIISPNKKDKDGCKRKIDELKETEKLADAEAKTIAKTKNGKSIFVYANASSGDDFEKAINKGCDAIGLFRIETTYLASKRLPDEEYLIEHFKNVLKIARQKEITIRLLDIGADKKLPYLEIEDELDPSLGLRGVRLLLKYEDLLKTQLKAILKLSSEFNLRILIPMVTFSEEIERIRKIVASCRVKLSKQRQVEHKNIKIGAMIETPAAVINLREIAKSSDFLSIGTNDLIQYTMAAGRESTSVSQYYEKGSNVIVNTIKTIVTTANEFNLECSICGEIAADCAWTEKLLKAGIKHLSVTPIRIPVIKDKIRNISL